MDNTYNHQTYIELLIQIWYKLFPKWKPNTWKLVIQEHGNASFSYMDLWYFDLHIIWTEEYRDIHHIPNIGHQISSTKCKHHSNNYAINMRVWGNGEEGLREWGDRWELECMELKPENKTPSFISHDIFKFPLHQPNWKGIQLPWNLFTSRESEHSPCNGQAKALQNANGQLKNDQNILSFIMKSFY